MPKIVNPEERRREVVEAVFRVVARGGIQQATLQNVAAEAGLAVGSVRHYFAGHRDLLTAAAREMVHRVEARVRDRRARLRPDDDPYTVAEDVAGQFLPLDAGRADETAVWLEFAVAARTDPELRSIAAELHDGLRTVAGRLLDRLGVTDPVATEHLAAVLDGLALNAALHPDRLQPDTVRAVLRQHLTQLPGAHRPGRADAP
ncbi:TetR family transcriptional regulator [Streptomyces sp. Ru73]|uniref:TetR/AcrR family transcriptional regulator n=1 Tax=Streptomyces sp. Ru73 TaxID=2080748 RepID=UPI000CDE2C04|nr:TetR family transcriptional regulator C-terminal domain-containing protein [Streptomyces sp. Ru73]POX37267.1 TetR family transcriptional regulator [Streptomyces sp. Ru73]